MGNSNAGSVVFCLGTDTSRVTLVRSEGSLGARVSPAHEGFSLARVREGTKPCRFLKAVHVREVIGRQTACFLGLFSANCQLLFREKRCLIGCLASSAKGKVKI